MDDDDDADAVGEGGAEEGEEGAGGEEGVVEEDVVLRVAPDAQRLLVRTSAALGMTGKQRREEIHSRRSRPVRTWVRRALLQVVERW